MKKEMDAILLRIFIGESDRYEGRPLYQYLIELFKKEGMSGATAIRGIEGFGKNSRIHTTSILRLSGDLPILIEVTDTKERIDKIKPTLDQVIKEGLVTEEKVRIVLYESNSKKGS